MIEVINKSEIELVGSRRVRETSAELLKEVDLAINTDSSNKGNDQTTNEELN